MSQTLFCWIWGLTKVKKMGNPSYETCHKPYFVGFEVWPLNEILFSLATDVSQTLFCWIWGLTTIPSGTQSRDKLSQTLFCWIWGLTISAAGFSIDYSKCHKPYFVGFEVWPRIGALEKQGEKYVTNLILLDLRSDQLGELPRLIFLRFGHKPYFVGFEVWPWSLA